MRWNVANSSLKPGTGNVHCIMMAYEFKMKHNLPIESAVDKAAERSKSQSVRISANGQKQKQASSKR